MAQETLVPFFIPACLRKLKALLKVVLLHFLLFPVYIPKHKFFLRIFAIQKLFRG